MNFTAKKLDIIIATEQELKDALAGIKGDVADLKVAAGTLNDSVDTVLLNIKGLKEQIAAGGVVSQADLDALTVDAQAADAAGDDLKAALAAAKEKLATAQS